MVFGVHIEKFRLISKKNRTEFLLKSHILGKINLDCSVKK